MMSSGNKTNVNNKTAVGAICRLLPCVRKPQLAYCNGGKGFRHFQPKQILPSSSPSATNIDLLTFFLPRKSDFGANTPDPHGKDVPREQRGPVYSLRLCAALLEQDQPAPGFSRYAHPSKRFRSHPRAEHAHTRSNKGGYQRFICRLDGASLRGHMIGRIVRRGLQSHGHPACQSNELWRAVFFLAHPSRPCK